MFSMFFLLVLFFVLFSSAFVLIDSRLFVWYLPCFFVVCFVGFICLFCIGCFACLLWFMFFGFYLVTIYILFECGCTRMQYN